MPRETIIVQRKKNVRLIEEKVIILDTCVLIDIMASPLIREVFLYFINEIKSEVTIAGPVYVEFINGIDKIENFFLNKEMINTFKIAEPFIDDKTIFFARTLATLNVFEQNRSKSSRKIQPSFSDHTLGALTAHEDLVIATTDHKDFPLYLYDRLYLKTLDEDSNIISIGFYKLNSEKYAALKRSSIEITKNYHTKNTKKK